MLKTSFTPAQPQYMLHLPTNYVGKRVEVIAYIDDEVSKEKESSAVGIDFETLKMTTKGFRFNREEANER